MKKRGISELEVYPEDRGSIAPTAFTVIDSFDDLYVSYFYKGGDLSGVCKDEFSDIQQKILDLFDIKSEKFWPKS